MLSIRTLEQETAEELFVHTDAFDHSLIKNNVTPRWITELCETENLFTQAVTVHLREIILDKEDWYESI